MDSLPLVSFVMPALNAASGDKLLWFRQAVESIAKQDYEGPIEIVLIDDGSTDRTPHAYLSFKQELETPTRQFMYHRLPIHVGITCALNHGLGRSNGEFIARLDSDDWCASSRTRKQVEFLQANPEVFLVGTPVKIIRFNKLTHEVWNTLRTHEQLVNGLRERNRLAHSSVMFRKNVLDSVGTYNEYYKYSQDWDYWWRIAQKHRIAQLEEPLTYYRLHKGCISADGRASQQDQYARQIKRKINSGVKS